MFSRTRLFSFWKFWLYLLSDMWYFWHLTRFMTYDVLLKPSQSRKGLFLVFRRSVKVIWVFPKWLSLNSITVTQFKSRVITPDISCLAIDVFLDEVITMKFLLLLLDRYLFSVVSSNRYLLRGNKENVLFYYYCHFRYVIPLVTIPLLER